MKRIFAFLIAVLLFLTSLTACKKREIDTDAMLREFISSYGAEGVIYSSACLEGEDGYLSSETLNKIYVIDGRFPENYAIFLNSHTDYGSECGAFVCDDTEMRLAVEEMCLERIRLLCGKDNSFVARSDNIVFYSTMQDRAKAEQLFKKIIK